MADNKVLNYDFEGPVAIRELKYDNSTDSMLFEVTHYNPDGGPWVIKMAFNGYSGSQYPLSITLDGKSLSVEKNSNWNSISPES